MGASEHDVSEHRVPKHWGFIMNGYRNLGVAWGVTRYGNRNIMVPKHWGARMHGCRTIGISEDKGVGTWHIGT